jgi:hypothetical protein
MKAVQAPSPTLVSEQGRASTAPPVAAEKATVEVLRSRREWIISDAGGPDQEFSTSDLVELYAKGKLKETTRVRAIDSDHWRELFDHALIDEALRARGHVPRSTRALPKIVLDDRIEESSPSFTGPKFNKTMSELWRAAGVEHKTRQRKRSSPGTPTNEHIQNPTPVAHASTVNDKDAPDDDQTTLYKSKANDAPPPSAHQDIDPEFTDETRKSVTFEIDPPPLRQVPIIADPVPPASAVAAALPVVAPTPSTVLSAQAPAQTKTTPLLRLILSIAAVALILIVAAIYLFVRFRSST